MHLRLTAVIAGLLFSSPAFAHLTAYAPHIDPPYVVGVRPGTPFIGAVHATGQAPVTFAARRLPKGLSLDAATRVISGSVAKAGDYSVEVTAKNAVGSDKETLHIVVGDKLALTPPMGWNSYDFYGDQVTESEFLANVRSLKDKLAPFGWDTVVVDYRWYDPDAPKHRDAGDPGTPLTMDEYGRLLPSPSRFPSAANGVGFKALADQVHAMGLKFGIHIMRGIPRNAVAANLPIYGSPYHAADAANTATPCSWCPDMDGVVGDSAAGQAYYASLANLYASWGVDYIKMDDTSQPYRGSEIEAVSKALRQSPHSIVYSLSPGETPVAMAAHVSGYANLWRVSGDFWDDWRALDHEFTLARRWTDAVGPGHWPDADMLPLGHISRGNRPVGKDRQSRFTPAEQKTLITLWCILPSPLMLGANLPDLDPDTLALLTNPEVLAIDQDAAGIAARPLPGDDEVWTRRLADGSLAVAVFNRTEAAKTVTVPTASLSVPVDATVRDLWAGKDLGQIGTALSVDLPPHAAALYRITVKR